MALNRYKLMLLVWAVTSSTLLHAQTYNRCGTMQLLEKKTGNDPSFKKRFEAAELQLQQTIAARAAQGLTQRTDAAMVTIPIVFHLVLNNQNSVTNAQVQAQVDTLNKDYAGLNGDSTIIPAYFKPFFGRSGLRFTLAQRTPDGEPTNGIIRHTSTVSSFSMDNSAIKHSAAGGADAWNTGDYLNVWITNLSNGILGYATFPSDSIADEQGVVIMYTCLPGGTATNFNGGKTLTHEIGHYFNVYHIWGDDNGACTGTDYIDDTPNQGGSTSGLPIGVKTDNCTFTSPGIMYQNYMDYTYDNSLVMFTIQQVTRMETALSSFRPSLIGSKGGIPIVQYARDAELRAVNEPGQRICSGSLTPVITIRNSGAQNLTSLTLKTSVDNGQESTQTWSGALASLATAAIPLNAITTTTGNHVLTVYATNPNGNTDQNTLNDTLHFAFSYYTPFASPVSENFEGTVFPSTGWDIVNPDASLTWQKVVGIAKTGNAAVVTKTFNYTSTGQKDYLRTPEVTIAGADSAFVSFYVAAAAVTPPGTANNSWDTLEVLISTDCGNTYTGVYKKWGASLVTRPMAVQPYFVPAAGEWRKDSIDISSYITGGKVLVAFRNTNGNENNIYLDDINVYKVVVNPNLKARGFLVTPNPATDLVTVQFYPQPKNLRSISLYASTGQKMAEQRVADGQGNNLYHFNVSGYASGIYLFRAVFSDRVVMQKLLKMP